MKTPILGSSYVARSVNAADSRMVIDSTNNKLYIYSGGSWVALN